ncbi:hypothetical protein [Photobacterium leiognathi]|uniref:hypothetical protein n=1 Tax=Photobacterium leiognathi TaxID=553611 RepID=UPI002981BAAE|nr:hypothetical protein [Photobacterium leiognathi]
MTKQRGLFISEDNKLKQVDQTENEANHPPATTLPVYVTQEDLRNFKLGNNLEFISKGAFVALLIWMGTYFVGRFDTVDERTQEISRAMAVAETEIREAKVTISKLEADLGAEKAKNEILRDRILKLEVHNQLSKQKP